MDENKAAVNVKKIDDPGSRREALNPFRSFIVQAPAGSGKTSLLVQRYLALLALDNVKSPENVLAITFTNKAAGEMRERIVKALNEAKAAREAPAEEFARKTYDLAKEALKKSEREEWDLLENPARLNIRTIDSLCGRLTRMLPLISRFGCPLEPSDDQKNMYARAASEMMHTLLYEASDDEWSKQLREDLKAVLYDFYDNMQTDMEAAIADLLEKRAEWVDLLDKRNDAADEKKEAYDEAYKVWREAADSGGDISTAEEKKAADKAYMAWIDAVADCIIDDAEEAYKAWRGAVLEQLKNNGVFNVDDDSRTVIGACKEMMQFSENYPKHDGKIDIKPVLEYFSRIEDINDDILSSWEYWKNLVPLLLNSSGALRKNFNGSSFTGNNFIPRKEKSKKLLYPNMKNFRDLLSSWPNEELTAKFEENLARARDCFGEEKFSPDSKAMVKRILRLGRFALECLEKVFSEEMSCDFEAISRSAVKASDPQNPNAEESFKLDKYLVEDDRIVHILVDEYQDTSRSQFHLLNNLMWRRNAISCSVCKFQNDCQKFQNDCQSIDGSPPQACDEEGHTVFCVGDPMQSIYRFRGADVSVYTHTQERGFDSFRESGDVEDSVLKPANKKLAYNFRSRHSLVNELGDIFKSIFPPKPEGGEIDIGIINFERSEAKANWQGANDVQVEAAEPEAGSEEAEDGQAESADEAKKVIEVKPILVDEAFKEIFNKDLTETEKNNYKARAYEADLIVGEIKKVREREKDSTIAVLLESKDLGTDILRKLQSTEDPIDVAGKSKTIPVSQKEVCSLDKAEPVPLLVAMTNVFLNVLERRYWFAVLRSKLVGLTLKEVTLLMERVLQEDPGGYNPPPDFWTGLGEAASEELPEALKNGLSENSLKACRRLYSAYKQAFETRRSMGLADSIRGLWMRLGGPAVCSREEAANAEQYFGFLKRFDKRGEWPNAKTLEDGLSQLFAESSMDEGNPVQFLTIHGAKGLEFDYVFLPGLASKRNPSQDKKLISVASFAVGKEEYTLISPVMSKKDGTDLKDKYFSETVKKLDDEGQKHEKVRLFYVAATRAKRCVYMYIHLVPERKQASKKEDKIIIGVKPKDKSKMLNAELWKRLAVRIDGLSKLVDPKDPAKYPDAYSFDDIFEEDYIQSYRDSQKLPVDRKTAKNNKLQRLIADWHEKVWHGVWSFNGSDEAHKKAQEDRFVKAGADERKARGTLVHDMLETLADAAAEHQEEYTDEKGELRDGVFSEKLLNKLIEEMEIKGHLDEGELEKVRKRALDILQRVLKSAMGRWILKPRKVSSAEEEFQCDSRRLEKIEKTGDDLMGRRYAKRIIDRSFIENGVCWIIDYKTGKPRDGENREEFYKHKAEVANGRYIKQLCGYAEIKKKLLGDKVREVKTALYFPLVGEGEELLLLDAAGESSIIRLDDILSR